MPDQLRAGDGLTPTPPPPPLDSSVCAVVVTYHPAPEVLGNLAAIRRQVPRVVVIDNGSSVESRALLAALAGDPGVELVFNPENRGIATALNQGLGKALAAGFAWVATFDQDSTVPEGYVAGLLAAYAIYPARDRVAVLAPLYRDRHLGFVYSPSGPVTDSAAPAVPVIVTATSGNLISSRAVRAAGNFRDDFFIDCVDFEFCLRYRKKGWVVLEVRGIILEHEQGRYERRRFLWKNPRVNDYDAVRRYYQARNRLVVYALYGGVDARWTGRDAWGYGCEFVKIILFSKNRWTKVLAVLAGARDALLGRMGPRAR